MGADPSKWRRDVPTFGEVRYPAVIDGVHSVYHGEEGQLEYDFVVAPGADPGAIALEVGGAQGLSLTPAGELCVLTARGRFVQPRPRVFQKDLRGRARGGRRLPPGRRPRGRLRGGGLRPGERLVIDPVLAYSSYLGGTFGDASRSIAADSDGNTYVAGWTQSAAFPTLAPYQAARRGLEDAFVAKLDPTGALVYSTYLGGARSIDGAYGVAVDAAGSAYVTGGTNSIDFPTVNAMACPACGVFVTEARAGGQRFHLHDVRRRLQQQPARDRHRGRRARERVHHRLHDLDELHDGEPHPGRRRPRAWTAS